MAIALPTAIELGIAPEYPGAYFMRTVLWLANRYGQRLEEVQISDDVPLTGSIQSNEDNAIKHALSLTVDRPLRFRPLRDFVIPELVISSPSGIVERRQLGLYLVMQPRTTLDPGRLTGTIEAKDLTYLSSRSQLGAASWPAGTDTGLIAREIMIGAGYTASQLEIPDTGVNTADAYAPKPGTFRLNAATEILNSSNWLSPWMNPATLTILTRPSIDLQSAVPRRIYSTASGMGMELVPPISEDPDTERLRNRVVVRNIAPDREPIWAEARVTNPAHPLFYDPNDPEALPLEMGEEVDDPNVPDEATALARAQSLLSFGASYYRKVTLRHVIDLDAGLHDVIGLEADFGGTHIYSGAFWRRTWNISIGKVSAVMQSELYRVEAWQ